jgi:tRNA-binding protein
MFPTMPLALKPQITLEDLERVDIRVGTILSVADVAGSEKLVALRVGFGDFERTILVGMKLERADPAEVVGRQALFVVNLAPRTMFGIVSEGMLFDIGAADRLVPCLAVPEWAVPDGTGAG